MGDRSEYFREYYKRTKEQRQQYRKEYNERNKEKINKYHQKYYKDVLKPKRHEKNFADDPFWVDTEKSEPQLRKEIVWLQAEISEVYYNLEHLQMVKSLKEQAIEKIKKKEYDKWYKEQGKK